MSAHDDVADILGRFRQLARERRPHDLLLRSFLGRFYRGLPADDVDDARLGDAYEAAAAQLDLGLVRMPGETKVKVLSPDSDGFTGAHAALMFVTDDVPFLVDTVRMVLERHSIGIHLLVHPMLDVERDDDGRIVRFGRGTGHVEAWTLYEIDRCTAATAALIEHEVHEVIDAVQQVVGDFDVTRERLDTLAGDDELLRWFSERHFVFLAAATYRRLPDDQLELVEGSELGEYRAGRLDAGSIDPPSAPGDAALVIARTDMESRIHRAARMTALSIRPQGSDLEHRFVGLLALAAHRESVFSIPVVRDRADAVLGVLGAVANTYTGRAVQNVLETLPRDLLFELGVDALAALVAEIVGLQERRIVRVFDVAEPVGPWTTVFVYVPRVRFDALLPDRVAELVAQYYGADTRDLAVFLGPSSLARISLSVRAPRADDHEVLVAAIDEVSTTWHERVRDRLIDELGDEAGRRVFAAVGYAASADYAARVSPADAIDDLVRVASLLSDPADDAAAPDDTGLAASLRRMRDPRDDTPPWRLRVYLRDRSASVAELVPYLEHLGLPPIDERPSVFHRGSSAVYVYDLGVELDSDRALSASSRAELEASLVGMLRGEIEPDGLNRLVLAADLDRHEVAIVRLYTRYLRQTGFPFSTTYIERAVVRHPNIARCLVDLFAARFDPSLYSDADARLEHVDACRQRLAEACDAVPSLDDDRIYRAFTTLIEATTRTNAYRGRSELAVKLEPATIAFLPQPRPAFEIFVCSPKVEGIHLRAGRISRGGLRWSDRPEDFRTEVLGLVKAQMVKNAVIVPDGAKGGFVVKGSTVDAADRDGWRAEGLDRYRRFIRALLDVTDNVVGREVVHPPDTVVYDGDDPYLVVAADKGTATFSDAANALAVEEGFWLGDAFASGGSNGYDHKEMGITARGAWESVRRHARALGLDADRDEMTAVGIGDMSGDVFGNGMLRSPHLKLVAAFDHRHVFLDPDPDPAVAFAERQRLFELPRSSWADYDATLISPGGSVHPRHLKAVPITPEVRAALGLDDDVTTLPTDALIAAILRAPVDLLWNGGIGTYVKGSTETNGDVGDRANDALRVDGGQLRARMVGEGGNLGFTQLGRVDYALSGGLINTDAIDNSAGVDCSDHEVNIKIALDALVRDGSLSVADRNAVLADMTDDVAELVLDDNRAQTLALMIARNSALGMINVHARYLDQLELEGYLDRHLEFLPTDRQIAERQSAGNGLSTPEFAVMIAYTKNADVIEVLDSDLPDEPTLERDLLAYFPALMRERFADAIRGHRLRREIIATDIVNSMVNLAGISFDHRMTEDSGASVSDVLRAFLASREIFSLPEIWQEIDRLDTSIDLDTQIRLFLDARRMTERGTVWLLRHRHPPLDIDQTVSTFAAGLAFLGESLETVTRGRVGDDIESLRTQRIDAGVPEDLAQRSARWPWLHTGFDVVEIAHDESVNVADVARAYWDVFDAFDLGWLWDSIGALPRSDRWQNQARSAMRDDLMTVLADLTRLVMRSPDRSPELWIAANERSVARALAMHTEIRRAETFTLTTLAVALRQLRNLTLTATTTP